MRRRRSLFLILAGLRQAGGRWPQLNTTIQKLQRLIKYFTLLTFIVGSCLVALVYFMPTHDLVDYSALYLIVWLAAILIFLLVVIFKIVRSPKKRKENYSGIFLLLFSLILSALYFFVWDYLTRSILVKVVNNTGQDVTKTAILDCSEQPQNWGLLKNGESKTVRFPGDISCGFSVTYQLNGVVRNETLPRRDIILNVYYLGNNPNVED